MNRRLVAMLTALVLVCAGCGETQPAPLPAAVPATTADLLGPWRPIPFLLDPAEWGRIERACITDMQMPPGSRAAIIDVRGAEVATVRLSGQNAGTCNSLQVLPNGTVTGAGAGQWGGTDPGEPAPGTIGGLERLAVEGGNLSAKGWSVVGRAGPGIETVTVDSEGCPTMLASLSNGWFAAWCPVRAPAGGLSGQPAPRVLVRGYDAFGNLVDETVG